MATPIPPYSKIPEILNRPNNAPLLSKLPAVHERYLIADKLPMDCR